MKARRTIAIFGLSFAVAAVVYASSRVLVWALKAAVPSGASFNESRWVLLSPWGRLGVWLGVAAASGALALAIVGTRRERRPMRRLVLIGLRAGACAAALILYLEPALELRHVTREPNHVAILVDDSRSMGISETRSGPTRAERAARLIADSASAFETWRRNHQIEFYLFSDTVLPTSESQLARIEPRGDATLLREALESVRSRYDRRDLAGVVVVSDGAATGRFEAGAEDGASREFLQHLRARVHTAWVGRPGLKDVALGRIHHDEFAFVRTALKVEVVVRATGFDKRQVPVALKLDGTVVKTQTATVGGDVPEARVSFELVPERVGKYVYEVTIPVDPEETVPDNNTRAFVLQVIRDRIRVLEVAGRPSWDVRALRGMLKQDPNIDLISFFILRTPDDIQADIQSRLIDPEQMSLIPFPTEELFRNELDSFDVVIVLDFNYGPYQIQPYLENIRAYVERGGALAMVGGDLAFSSGGYYRTPVAAALPVELLPGGTPDRLVSTEEFRMRLTPEGLRHPVMQLRFEARENRAQWDNLPQLEGLNLVAGQKPGSTLLAVHPHLKSQGDRPMPVIACGEHGKGRTLALLTDSAWRWGLPAAGRGDDGRAHQKFWQNAIRWLIRDPELELLHIESDQSSYPPGVTPELRARLVDSDYRPKAGSEIRIQVTLGTGAKSQIVQEVALRSDEAGEAKLELKPLAPDVYRVSARATVGDREVTAEDVFLVNAERAELSSPGAREDILRGISAATAGKWLGEATRLPEDLELAPPHVVRVDKRQDLELWNRPWLFILALTFLGAEWALRRRGGYV